MGLYDSPLHIAQAQNIFSLLEILAIFQLGFVEPSNDLFLSDY